jgi:hypothetical protein
MTIAELQSNEELRRHEFPVAREISRADVEAAAELEALLPAILDKAFRDEL